MPALDVQIKSGTAYLVKIKYALSGNLLVPQGGIQNSKFKIQNEYRVMFSEILNGMSIYAVLC
ncbi:MULTISPECIES: hypothetical protein [unclassified Nodularia (in: cyanobacteria)]|uniref:hypothetical protein n=1 Tax=unclassified Nodularia (in: cyanobacteria) TaxID=2656917 RepID=UPI00188252E0|nr:MULTISPECIES: hypothetical protein [unclassified Nodularia (in: cyanobacteria)]MBE9201852.1 hypothetical protein [Nodularia sp. LEGE 06071]MCC2693239.1 hypothetical protein [Nodularia sp. LEGE 04288]